MKTLKKKKSVVLNPKKTSLMLNIEVNKTYDVRDSHGKWLEGIIKSYEGNNEVLVHYIGWKSKWDEIININNEIDRFAILGKYSDKINNKYNIEVGQIILVKPKLSSNYKCTVLMIEVYSMCKLNKKKYWFHFI